VLFTCTKVLAFAAGAGALMLAVMPASGVVEAVLYVPRKAGLEDVSADATYAEFRLSYNPQKNFP
jgi:hypothetical protein